MVGSLFFLPPPNGCHEWYTLPFMRDNPEREEVDRLLLVLRTVIRILGHPLREVERRLGLHPSYLGRLFQGVIEPKVEHVLAVSRALGLAPAEFFDLVYPQRPDPPSESSKAIHKLLRD